MNGKTLNECKYTSVRVNTLSYTVPLYILLFNKTYSEKKIKTYPTVSKMQFCIVYLRHMYQSGSHFQFSGLIDLLIIFIWHSYHFAQQTKFSCALWLWIALQASSISQSNEAASVTHIFIPLQLSAVTVGSKREGQPRMLRCQFNLLALLAKYLHSVLRHWPVCTAAVVSWQFKHKYQIAFLNDFPTSSCGFVFRCIQSNIQIDFNLKM